MKKAIAASAFVFALLISTVAGAQFINLATARLVDDHLSLDVSIPEGRAYDVTNYEVYAKRDVILYFLVDHDWIYANQLQKSLVTVDWYGYNLDGHGNVTFTPYSQQIQYHYYPSGGKSVTEINSLKLLNLSEGWHSIVVYAKMASIIAVYSSGHGTIVDLGSVTAASNMSLFKIDAEPPRISILSPENKAYYTSDVPLDITVNEPVTQITYNLDGSTHVLDATAGNTTLTGLPIGAHTITVHAQDTAGNIGNSETVTFSIAQESETTPFPTSIVAAGAAAVTIAAVFSVCLVIYFRKRKY